MATPPDAVQAGRIAAAVMGARVREVRRFTTGSQHFVFEAVLAGRAPVVVRISRLADVALAAGASRLSRKLRPLGVRLPEVLAEDFEPPFPFMVLERLPGRDLGEVMGSLSATQLEAIAGHVAAAQRIVAATPSARRYGYAVEPELAPREHWAQILEDSIARSRSRIAAAGLFDQGPVEAAERVLTRLRAEADDQPAVPYLHDTTTKNVIIGDDGSFSGIVDVDDLCFGDPRYVLALTRASVIASGGPLHYVEAWMRAAGHVDDPLFRFYVVLCLLDFMSEQGQVFNGNERASTPEVRRALHRAFLAELQRAEA